MPSEMQNPEKRRPAGELAPPRMQPDATAHREGQFGIALEPQVVKICGWALLVGLIGGLVAQGLLELIYFFTNLFFYGRFSFAISHPVGNHLGLWVILIPPIGGLVVGTITTLLFVPYLYSVIGRGDPGGSSEPAAAPTEGALS